MGKDIEKRVFNLVEARVEQRAEGQPTRIVGHAAVFDQITDIGWFKEKVDPGAFKRTIKKADVRMLFNHDSNVIMGRTKSKTLTLSEDEKGLAIENTPPDTQLVRDMVLTPMERGDLDQMSFAFQVIKDHWEGTLDDPIRVLEEVELFDVSVVTYPAYPTTDASVRSAEMRQALQPEPPQGGPPNEPAQGCSLEVLEAELDLEASL